MLHAMQFDWPCLSFDVLSDKLGFQRKKYPLTAYFAFGTQADSFNNNKIMVTKMSALHKTKFDDDSDFEDEDEDDDDDEAELEFRSLKHPGSVNRIRVMSQDHFAATWSEDGGVYIWDLREQVKALDVPPPSILPTKHLQKLGNHPTEGFALDWSKLEQGKLLSGDCSKNIFMTTYQNSSFLQDSVPFSGHSSSVEDLQWSPTESNIFISCSSDKSVKVWDIRTKKAAAKSFLASDVDVNVVSWNSKVTYLIASGADDGAFKIWDLRSLKGTASNCESLAHFKWHRGQITSIEWDPNDDTVIAVSGSDDQVSIWDLSVEKEDFVVDNVPPQLMFSHQGQTHIKEIHWHPQIPNMVCSTAENFNLFQPNFVDLDEDDDEDDELNDKMLE